MADLPTNFEEFADARKGAFMKVKDFKENGGNLVGVLCSYTPVELIEAAGAVAIGLCGTSNETVADAEEVAQDAFVKAYKALGRFRLGSPFRPWLLRIVANEARISGTGPDRTGSPAGCPGSP